MWLRVARLVLDQKVEVYGLEWIPFRLLWLICIEKCLTNMSWICLIKYVLKMFDRFFFWTWKSCHKGQGIEMPSRCFASISPVINYFSFKIFLIKFNLNFLAFYNNIPALFSTSFASESKSTAVDFVLALLYQRFHLWMKHNKTRNC